MIEFLTDLQVKKSDKAGNNWPSLVPAKVEGLKILNLGRRSKSCYNIVRGGECYDGK